MPEQAMEALRQELAATNAILTGLYDELHASRVETAVRVEGLRAETHRQRRTRLMVVVAGGIGLAYAQDVHVEHCSPGARVSKGVDYLISHPASEVPAAERDQAFTQIYNETSFSCDVSFPMHQHGGRPYPTLGNDIGFGILAVIAVGTWFWHRWRTRREYALVARAAEMEGLHGSNAGAVRRDRPDNERARNS